MIRLAALLVLALLPGGEETIALTHARILTGTGREINSGVILIEGGKIRKLGADVPIPEGARVVDLQGKVVIPGLVDAASALGVAGAANEEGEEVAPQVRILDSVDPRSPEFARARQSGVTTAFVGPGNRGVIGGIASVVKTSGGSRASMVLREEAALKGAIGPTPAAGNFSPRGAAASFYARRPTTRMGVAWEFRKAFFDAQRYRESHETVDPGKEVLIWAMTGKLPVRIAASRATDVETALQIAGELKLTIALEEGQEAYKRAESLARLKIPVVLRPVMSLATIPNPESSDARPDAFVLLTKAGVKTALLPVSDQKSDGLLASAAFAIRFGASLGDALRAVTLTPAEIAGVADRVGSLEEGKDADLVVLSGAPGDVTSRVEKVMIDGRWVFGERSDR